MQNKVFQYIYGPLYSWRLGLSLGIDPLSNQHKICNMDCVYCQLGKTVHWSNQRKEYVPTEDIVKEIKAVTNTDIDYLTFSGRGEPTLAKNLGSMIKSIRKVRKERIAVITNASLLNYEDVREDLLLCDFVLAKLDAYNQHTFESIDQATKGINFKKIIEGIKKLKKVFKGRLALQLMFIEQNKHFAKSIADLVRNIAPDEVQINTPLRPSAARALSPEELEEIKGYFLGLPVNYVYEKEIKQTQPFDEKQTIKRHGNYKGENG